jgi:hypothetical protein
MPAPRRNASPGENRLSGHAIRVIIALAYAAYTISFRLTGGRSGAQELACCAIGRGARARLSNPGTRRGAAQQGRVRALRPPGASPSQRRHRSWRPVLTDFRLEPLRGYVGYRTDWVHSIVNNTFGGWFESWNSGGCKHFPKVDRSEPHGSNAWNMR